MWRLRLSVLGLAAAIAVGTASPAVADDDFRLEIGPPVAAGGNFKLKNAVVMVRPLACDDPSSVVMTGTAVGIVHGVRQSVPLKLLALATPGVHAVTKQWADGTWIVNLTGRCPARAAIAGAVVPLDAKGAFVRDRSRFFTRAATDADIEASLSAIVKDSSSR